MFLLLITMIISLSQQQTYNCDSLTAAQRQADWSLSAPTTLQTQIDALSNAEKYCMKILNVDFNQDVVTTDYSIISNLPNLQEVEVIIRSQNTPSNHIAQKQFFDNLPNVEVLDLLLTQSFQQGDMSIYDGIFENMTSLKYLQIDLEGLVQSTVDGSYKNFGNIFRNQYVETVFLEVEMMDERIEFTGFTQQFASIKTFRFHINGTTGFESVKSLGEVLCANLAPTLETFSFYMHDPFIMDLNSAVSPIPAISTLKNVILSFNTISYREFFLTLLENISFTSIENFELIYSYLSTQQDATKLYVALQTLLTNVENCSLKLYHQNDIDFDADPDFPGSLFDNAVNLKDVSLFIEMPTRVHTFSNSPGSILFKNQRNLGKVHIEYDFENFIDVTSQIHHQWQNLETVDSLYFTFYSKDKFQHQHLIYHSYLFVDYLQTLNKINHFKLILKDVSYYYPTRIEFDHFYSRTTTYPIHQLLDTIEIECPFPYHSCVSPTKPISCKQPNTRYLENNCVCMGTEQPNLDNPSEPLCDTVVEPPPQTLSMNGQLFEVKCLEQFQILQNDNYDIASTISYESSPQQYDININLYEKSTTTHLTLDSDCFDLKLIDQTANRTPHNLAHDSTLSHIKFSLSSTIETNNVCESVESADPNISKQKCPISAILTINSVPQFLIDIEINIDKNSSNFSRTTTISSTQTSFMIIDMPLQVPELFDYTYNEIDGTLLLESTPLSIPLQKSFQLNLISQTLKKKPSLETIPLESLKKEIIREKGQQKLKQGVTVPVQTEENLVIYEFHFELLSPFISIGSPQESQYKKRYVKFQKEINLSQQQGTVLINGKQIQKECETEIENLKTISVKGDIVYNTATKLFTINHQFYDTTTNLPTQVLNLDCLDIAIIDKTDLKNRYDLTPSSNKNNVNYEFHADNIAQICPQIQNQIYNCVFSTIYSINNIPQFVVDFNSHVIEKPDQNFFEIQSQGLSKDFIEPVASDTLIPSSVKHDFNIQDNAFKVIIKIEQAVYSTTFDPVIATINSLEGTSYAIDQSTIDKRIVKQSNGEKEIHIEIPIEVKTIKSEVDLYVRVDLQSPLGAPSSGGRLLSGQTYKLYIEQWIYATLQPKAFYTHTSTTTDPNTQNPSTQPPQQVTVNEHNYTTDNESTSSNDNIEGILVTILIILILFALIVTIVTLYRMYKKKKEQPLVAQQVFPNQIPMATTLNSPNYESSKHNMFSSNAHLKKQHKRNTSEVDNQIYTSNTSIFQDGDQSPKLGKSKVSKFNLGEPVENTQDFDQKSSKLIELHQETQIQSPEQQLQEILDSQVIDMESSVTKGKQKRVRKNTVTK